MKKKPSKPAPAPQPLALVESVKPKPTKGELLTAMARLKREQLVEEKRAHDEARAALLTEIQGEIIALAESDPSCYTKEAHFSHWGKDDLREVKVSLNLNLNAVPARIRTKIGRLYAMEHLFVPDEAEIKRQLRTAMATADQRVDTILADPDARAALKTALEKFAA